MATAKLDAGAEPPSAAAVPQHPWDLTPPQFPAGLTLIAAASQRWGIKEPHAKMLDTHVTLTVPARTKYVHLGISAAEMAFGAFETETPYLGNTGRVMFKIYRDTAGITFPNGEDNPGEMKIRIFQVFMGASSDPAPLNWTGYVTVEVLCFA
jgi:hypothetical protein